jgi:hypothetical protein
MRGVDQGIVGDSQLTGALVYNNNLAGNNLWTASFIDTNLTWNDDGVTLPGFGNCAWNNTLHAFGDSFAVTSAGAGGGQRAEGIYFYRNRVSMTGDDTVEFDYGTRNIGFYDNKVANAGTFISLSPAYGGPFYAFRNIVVNTIRGPLKINDDVTGFLVYNNTFVRTTGEFNFGWIQFNNGAWQNYSYRNNLLVYRGSTSGGGTFALEATDNNPSDFDHNAWFPDGVFDWVQNYYSSLAATRSGLATVSNVFSSVQRHVGDVVTVSNPFANAITLGSNYLTEYTANPDATLSGSGPKNIGVAISNITDGFSGAAPDIGAIIEGRAVVTYGHTP